MRSKFEVQSVRFKRRLAAAVGSLFLLAAAVYWQSPATVLAHGGVDDEPKAASTPGTAQAAVSVVTAERNIQNESGQFNLVLKRSAGDTRTGETTQFLLRIAEKVEGGFGGGGPVPLDKASVSAKITKADGTAVVDNLTVTAAADANYRTSYAFGSSGDYKIVFAVATNDNRNFSADFPVSVTSAPVRRSFWIGLLILTMLTLGTIGAVFFVSKRKDGGKFNLRRFALLTVVILFVFGFGTVALAYFLPPRETRTIAELLPGAKSEGETNTLPGSTILTVPKESQILFGVKTEAIGTRKITSGLKTTGVVRPKPDARAVVSTQVPGKILLREGMSLGSAVTRGEQIGTIEQVLDVSTQSGLEAQRLTVEAKKLEIKNSLLQLQAQQADQRAKAQQARTRLAQAQRELRRSQNLVDVNAVPKKRVEEAQTAVIVAEQEVASAEQQVQLLNGQIKQTQAGQSVINSQNLNRPILVFPLTAPVTGIVNGIKATSGQQLVAGTEILSIVNLSSILIEANVFERDLPTVRESTRASFTSAALGTDVYTIGTKDGDGRLVSIGQTVNEQTRTFPVIYEMKNPLGRLREGMFVEITIDTSGDRQVLAVPKRAVVNEQGQTFVFVFMGGETFEKRPVALGAEGADYYEIKSGLKEGERVVTDGLYQLRSTQPGTQ